MHGIWCAMWLSGNRRYCDCNIYVSVIATSADRVLQVRILMHFGYHIHALNEALCLINHLMCRCVAQD
jgi:hypothetical protein